MSRIAYSLMLLTLFAATANAQTQGPVVTGYVRDSAGRSHSFWKSDLTSIDKQRGKSPMPSYKGQLTDPELTDLVAYLASLKEKK